MVLVPAGTLTVKTVAVEGVTVIGGLTPEIEFTASVAVMVKGPPATVVKVTLKAAVPFTKVTLGLKVAPPPLTVIVAVPL